MHMLADHATEAHMPGNALPARYECAVPLIGEPIDQASAAGVARFFKALGDPVRLRLMTLIGAHQGGEVCVCELTAAFNLSQSTISHHLKVLREAGIIDSDRRGTWVYYKLVPEALQRMSGLLSVSGH